MKVWVCLDWADGRFSYRRKSKDEVAAAMSAGAMVVQVPQWVIFLCWVQDRLFRITDRHFMKLSNAWYDKRDGR